MSGNGSPLSPPSPDAEQRVAAHLRKSRGLSVRLLARRYRRSLVGYLHALEADHRGEDERLFYPRLDPRTVAGLKIVAACAAERARFARESAEGVLPADPRALVGEGLDDALGALAAIADGTEQEGLRRHYPADERAPPYLIVLAAITEVSERGKMD